MPPEGRKSSSIVSSQPAIRMASPLLRGAYCTIRLVPGPLTSAISKRFRTTPRQRRRSGETSPRISGISPGYSTTDPNTQRLPCAGATQASPTSTSSRCSEKAVDGSREAAATETSTLKLNHGRDCDTGVGVPDWVCSAKKLDKERGPSGAPFPLRFAELLSCYGGGRCGIRTHGALREARRFLRPPQSAALATFHSGADDSEGV